jgi:hypothetical protein
MKVKDAMRPAWALDTEASLSDVVEAIQATGCEAVPIAEQTNGADGANGANGEVVVRQIVTVRDLPRLLRIEESARRGHAVGTSALDLLGALGRRPGFFPTIRKDNTLVDAWGLMADECTTHLPVVEKAEVVGMLSLVVTFSEFPHRSPAAGFWR